MKTRYTFLFLSAFIAIFTISNAPAMAQENIDSIDTGKDYSWDNFVEEYFSENDEDDEMPEQNKEELENLWSIHDNPIDINNTTSEDLIRLPFLNKIQADSIISYVKRYGPVYSISELMYIPQLSFQIRRYLTLFLYCDLKHINQKTFTRKLVEGKHEFAIVSSTPLYTAAGYKNDALSNEKKYLGDKNYTSLRYKYNYNNELLYGITAEKDAGEPFACRGNTLYDSYSLYFCMKKPDGKFSYCVGDYRINLGEGLVIGSGFAIGKKGMLYGTYNSNVSIRPHTSTSEEDFMRGAAGNIRFGKFLITGFVSFNKYDAILNEQDEITSLLKSGYHRTILEQGRKNNIDNSLYGGDISFSLNKMVLGISSMVTNYNHKFNPKDTEYNKYLMHGKNFNAYSGHYNFNNNKCVIKGEFALSENNATAFINTIKYSPKSYITFINIVRDYSKKYAEPFAYAFKSSGRVQNERGIYNGFSAELNNWLIIKGYADFYRFPWQSYKYRAPLNGQELYAEEYIHNQSSDFISIEYKYNHRKCDRGTTAKDTIPSIRHLTRLTASFDEGPFNFNTNITNVISKNRDKFSRGWLVGQKVKFERNNMQVCASAFYFNTDDYNSRVYSYERNVMYIYSPSTSFYNQGFRFSMFGKMKFKHWGEISCKYGLTHYFNKSTIGSGAQEIDSHNKSDIIFQARFFFETSNNRKK